ncbi:hypothetical protein LZ639_05365 [Pseudomonas stutzeri]|jgi:hypothetical protein|uniref:hypothetical protein n=1 Tax=Stutzerimonas stutzeri TaxID=316 RepID=UPI000E94C6F2|nr:hypothetical protein [Stutzerimonas stutzeri]HAN54652.1 hypothetical protein [Pseudomonas sp.]MCF0014748.1 hypothetical protein [Stutzerimonas stutzeri]MCF0018542.1 hypothetical protein [Stutzerimonas stutzeri]MDH0100859.1 hypothetical protein [Stutzerimonas stutzeri]MDH0155795.1 hypothetical protein [Stutzerimonas stutzeri]
MSKRLPLIAGAAVAVLVAGYFGLSAYSSSQAEKLIEDWVYEHELEDTLRWKSVSSSPFGGRVTISELKVEAGEREPSLQVAEVIISDRSINDERTRLRLRFNGVEADSHALGDLSSLGAMAGGGFGRSMATARGFEPALISGLAELKPYDVEIYVDIDDDAGTLETELAVDLPELFDSRVSYRLSNLRDLNRKLQRLSESFGGDGREQRAFMSELGELVSSVERAELQSALFSVKDRGMAERSIALYQRYNTPLNPTEGSAEKQRQAHYEKVVERTEKDCSREFKDLPKGMKDGCELLRKALLGKVSGMELKVEPKERVRLSDLGDLQDGRRSKRLLDRLNPQLDSI